MMEPESRGFAGGNLILPITGIAILVIIVAVVAITCGGGDGDGSGGATNRTPTPEPTQQGSSSDAASALADFVRTTLNAEYAGDCANTTVERDAGKYCSASQGEREGIHAFVLGLAFSEFSRWAFVEQRGGAWQVVHSPEITPDNRVVPGVPWPLRTGAEVEVVGTGSCLNVRTEPGGQAVDCIAEGTRIKLAAGPREANVLQWWQVDGRNGWVAADYLRYPDAKTNATPAPRATATPAAGATGTPRP
jgi:hypothetical protein